MFPAGFWSRESVRRLALQLEGDRWASACPPLTVRSRRPRTKPLATDGPPGALDIGTFLRWLAICECMLRSRCRGVRRADCRRQGILRGCRRQIARGFSVAVLASARSRRLPDLTPGGLWTSPLRRLTAPVGGPEEKTGRSGLSRAEPA